MMSFLGSIGAVMSGSGLSEALQTIYAPKAVEHMISGKAVSRALRGHFLLGSALMTQLLNQCFPELLSNQETVKDPSQESNDKNNMDNGELVLKESFLNEYEVNQIKSLCKKVLEEPVESVALVNSSEEISKLRTLFEEYKDELTKTSRTAKLWLQYLDYINILQFFICAERTGNWNLHLVSVGKMINLFAATAHINYARSSRLYLQTMLDLPETHPWVYENFAVKGFHTVQRSDRFWAGLWTDLVIEQVIMRAIKSRGGLTRGRGVSENVRVMWINSMHRCASVHNAMCTFTGLQHKTSEQHIELGVSRVKRDNDDLEKLQSWLKIHSPFDKNETALKSLSTGLIVGDGMNVNCDEADKVGQSIQEKLDAICVEDASIKQNDRVITLDTLRPGIKIDAKTVHIDPTILFTRLTAIAQTEEEVCQQFYYELTPEPTALFKDGFMRKSSKAVLRNHLLDMIIPEEMVDATTCVIDGGALLHKVKWLPKSTYGDIIDLYLQFLCSRYNKYSVVCIVFDGYTDEQSNKAEEQSRRSSAMMSADIKFTEQTDVTTTREMFLRNAGNKEFFINLLTDYLRRAGFVVVKSTGDADVLIAQKSIEYALQSSVVTCADDTDILVLLAYHCCDELNDIYFSTETRKGNKAKPTKFWCVNKLVELLPHREFLLFAHAWSGCDSTSATHLKGT